MGAPQDRVQISKQESAAGGGDPADADDFLHAQPTYPALGGSGWRGVNQPVVVFQWDYAALLPLQHAAGMEIRIFLEHDRPLGGSYVTATVYGLSEDE